MIKLELAIYIYFKKKTLIEIIYRELVKTMM